MTDTNQEQPKAPVQAARPAAQFKPLSALPGMPVDQYMATTLSQVQQLLIHGKIPAAIDMIGVCLSLYAEALSSRSPEEAAPETPAA